MKSLPAFPPAVVACLLFGLASCTAVPPTTSARATVDRFLDFYFHEYGSGLPSADERAKLRPLLTDELAEALERAAAAERCARERARGQEPPLIQGDLFSSLFEKATAIVDIDQDAADHRMLTYRLDFEWREPGALQAAETWSDEVILQRVGGRWLIDDFIHGGDWQFTHRGSVKGMLLGVAATCPASP